MRRSVIVPVSVKNKSRLPRSDKSFLHAFPHGVPLYKEVFCLVWDLFLFGDCSKLCTEGLSSSVPALSWWYLGRVVRKIWATRSQGTWNCYTRQVPYPVTPSLAISPAPKEIVFKERKGTKKRNCKTFEMNHNHWKATMSNNFGPFKEVWLTIVALIKGNVKQGTGGENSSRKVLIGTID